MNNELRDKVIEIVRDVYDRQAQVFESADEIIELVEAALAQQQEAEPVVDGGFVRAWINLDKLPGVMMNGPDGIFGPIPATTSCRITTSERELACWKSHAEVYLHPPMSAAQPTMDDAIATGNGTLHGAIDYWQQRALKAEAAQPQVPDNGMTVGASYVYTKIGSAEDMWWGCVLVGFDDGQPLIRTDAGHYYRRPLSEYRFRVSAAKEEGK